MTPTIDLSTIRTLLPCNCKITNTSNDREKRIDIWTPVNVVSYDYCDMLRMLYSFIGYEWIAEILRSKNDRYLVVYFINDVRLISTPQKIESKHIEIYRDHPIHLATCRSRYTYFYAHSEHINGVIKVSFVKGHARRYNNALAEIKQKINNIQNVTASTVSGIKHKVAI